MKVMIDYTMTPLPLNTLAIPTYDAVEFLAFAHKACGVKNDYKLAQLLGVAPPTLSRIRNRAVGLSNEMLLIIHEASGVSIKELKEAAGIPLYIPRRKRNEPS